MNRFEPAPTGPAPARVIVVDLDLTLLKCDTLHEQAVRLMFSKPARLPGLATATLRGPAAAKAYVADHIELDPANLLACSEVLAFLAREKREGARLVLCTAAERRVADGVAEHLGIFDEVIASEAGVNLKGEAKAALLAERYPGGFVYAGDHAADLKVWARSSGIVLVGTSADTEQKARALGKPILGEFRRRAARTPWWSVWARALRVHHWSKNLLLLVPLLLAHRWNDPTLIGSTAIGFLLLLAVTSSTYLINDLADLDSDRRHDRKRHRPLASGELRIAHAMAFAGIAVPVALVAGFFLNLWFGVALTAYFIITLAYSFRLRSIPLLDTFTIAVLFTTRLLMGSAFIGSNLPVWLLTFSMFFFFSLAMAKRQAEILHSRRAGDAIVLKSRGYEPDDGPLVLALGVGAGLGSIVILVLYMVDEAFRVVGYARPEFLWLVSLFVAVWVGRIWLLTHRGRLNDDPVSFALRDRPSQLIAGLILICFLIAL
jgi:4-hydroxybenzoate polyprenyltransferase